MAESYIIISRDNSMLKFVRGVRDGKAPEHIFIEGVRLAEEALRSDLSLEECFVSVEFSSSERGRNLFDELIKRGLKIYELSERLFKSIADTVNSQGIILIAKRPKSALSAIASKLLVKNEGLSLVIYLHEVNDPSNLGAVLRTAEAAGIAGVIVSNRSADVYSPKALRSAMGASFRLLIHDRSEFEEILSWAVERGLRITAAHTNGHMSYSSIDWQLPRLLVFGSEAHGLSREVRDRIDDLVHIPMKNNVESLNLAVSSGIILFEAIRQHS